MFKRIVIMFICFISVFSFAQYYILTDLGRGVEKIEVDLLTPEPIYVQDSPNMKVYLIKFKDGNLPVASGMSGSPLISNGKVIGALFAGYSFQREPLAFVIPIEYMDKIRNNYTEMNKLINFGNISSKSIPLVITLPDEKSFNLFSKDLKNVFPSNTVFNFFSPQIVDPKNDDGVKNNFGVIREGSSISVAFVDGDIKIFGTGTLTKIDKDGYFVAFGHSMFNLGSVSMPVYESKVITIVNRYDDSFKLSAITNKKIGSIIFDSNYGVLGKIGQDSKMIPLNMEISVSNKKIKNYSCYVVDNQKIMYVLSLIAFYNAIKDYVQSDLPYEFYMSLGFINGRVQNITIPSINTPIEKLLPMLYEYLNFISNIPSQDNRVSSIKFSLNINPQNLGIINNISISNKEDNNISFDINYFDPILRQSGKETVNVVFPTEAANESLSFSVGGQYDLPRMFEELGIMWTPPKDFNQLITFINFFSRPDPKSLSVVISTKLYGAINYAGKVIPLTTPQLYKYYLQYSMPFIYLSYYPVIIVRKTNFIPLGYDIFQIDINGSISKAERKKQEKTILSYIKNAKNMDNNSFIIKRNSNNVNSDDVEQEIYNILKNYNTKTNREEENTNNKGNQEQEKEGPDTDSNMVNLSNYEDLVDGTQNNVVIDYQSNIAFSQESLGEIKVDKPLFKILYHNNQFLGFSYNFDNSTNLYVFKNDGKIINSVKFDGIFSDVRLSNNKIVASTYEGQIIIINPTNFSIEKKINTDYVFQNADFYKNYLVATNIKYPSSLVFFSLDGNKLREEVLPFINISNLLIDGDNILLACYGGMVLKMNEDEKKYFQTYQENVTALGIVDDNLLIGTYPKPYLYVIPNYRNSTGFNRPILYDGFDTNGYVEDIMVFNNKIFLSYKGGKLSVFSIKKDELLGVINDTFQKTDNLNWEKNISVPNFYWFIPFVKSSEKFYIPYISNTFTVINFSNKSEKGYYISKVFDSGQQKYLYDLVIRAEGNYDLFIRWGNNPIVDQTWTKWISYKDINKFNYQYRYFQYKFIIYPGTTIHSIFGLFEKINYKPFFIIDSGRKVYNSNGSINVSLWDPNGDKLNVYLKYYDGKRWIEIDKKQITTKKTDVNTPDFSTNLSLNISKLNNKKGKIKLKIVVDDLPLNPSNYFIQEQEIQIFIDNSKPVIKKYTYVNGLLRVLVEDDSFVEAFVQNGKDIIPMKLKKIENNVYEYILNVSKLDKQIQIIVKDEAENNQELKVIL